ncbi:phospholipase C [Streptomyces violens]|uniref:phospholipase C n=1 Tax=Streptomyces violens TaxID=66377 RepID=UPI0004C14393|nr:alkaline phosphatase family protein [Streptomyces violens]
MSRAGKAARRAGGGRSGIRWAALLGTVALGVCGTAASAGAAPAAGAGRHGGTATPIKHLVVIFDENISFDHYFATYPEAANTDGTKFTPAEDTPKDIDNLRTAGLLDENPNQYRPKRLTPEQAMTCDQKHDYSPEQYAYNGGKADEFVENTDSGKCSGGLFGEPGLVMDYYDGNTVTAMWNYAQHYALSDRSFSTTYGPSTPGAINLVSGQTHGIVTIDPHSSTEHPRQADKPDPGVVSSPDAKGVGTMTLDPDPAYDDCSDKDHTSGDNLGAMTGRNIGDLLNSRRVSWGWFQGGFRPGTAWDGKKGHYAQCAAVTHTNVGGQAVEDYSPHHNPFAYYKTTSNPHHLAPRNTAEIGHAGRANHNYDLTDLHAALKARTLPAVSFVKAPAYQDAHAGNSSPTDEQHFLIDEINRIQKSAQWKDTAIVVAYDDSDGWYDHVYAKPRNGSKDGTPNDNGQPTDAAACREAPAAAGGYADRCGPGTRQPLLVISPYSKVNHIDHTPTEQTSITRFIEDNWHTGRIGDASFDSRANPLTSMFDFAHPNNKRVLLAKDGSVSSTGPIPPVQPLDPAAAPSGTDPVRAAAAPDTANRPTETSSLPLGIGIGVAAILAAAGTAFALHRRRSHTEG